VGCILNGMDNNERRAAYACDITYGTNNEFGFDYLRDNMVVRKENMVQRDLHYAIIDEVDSVLIDEARTPLIISGSGSKSTDLYRVADLFVKKLKKGRILNEDEAMNALLKEEIQEEGDFVLDEKAKSVVLTQEGVAKAEKYFSVDNLSDPENLELQHYINNALKANYNMHLDKDYVIQTFEKVGGFMTDIYNYADYDYGQNFGGGMLASATDESVYSVSGTSIETFYNGSWSPSNAQGSLWSNMYKGIKTCNVVLKDFQDLKFEDFELNADYQQQMFRYENYKWEARFWRAYFYFNLVRQYGGVPIITPEMAAADVNNQPRKSSDEVFQYIFDECDAVKDSIIKDYSDLGSMALSTAEDGRANNLTVLALKARAALYWASPLFNPSGDKERYHKAALYTKELLDACEARGMKLAAKYADLWSTNNYKDADKKCEIIFGRRIYGTKISSTDPSDNMVESYNYPFGIDMAKDRHIIGVEYTITDTEAKTTADNHREVVPKS
jgi:hypothetical protein